MINCPKCNLLQPKDQYCAQCGVNMETWKPPKKPFLTKILSNWMVQLALLFVLIVGVVTWDNLTNRKSQELDQSLPPVAKEIQRAETANFASNNSKPPDTEIEAPPPVRNQETQPNTKAAVKQNIDPGTKAVLLKKQVSLKLLTLNTEGVESLAQIGRKLDEGTYAIKKSDGFFSKNRKNMKGFGSAIRKDFEFGQPVELFFGEVDQVTGASLGFFVQITVAEGSTATALNFEGRIWHQLKLADEPSTPLFIDASLKLQEGLIVVDPTVHDLQFSPEEIALFDSSRKLSLLSDELFVDNLSDVTLLVEFR